MSTIYHYCDINSFFNIIKSKKIWLSAANNLNDHQEIYWFINKLKNRLLNEKINKNLLENFFEAIELSSYVPYICSFSKCGDLLSQWRAYANDGTGVAIGFNYDALGLASTIPTPGIFLHNSTGISEVTYDDKIQEALLDSVIKKAIDVINENTSNDYEKYIDIIDNINQFACICKNPAFSEEQEVRVIYSPAPLLSSFTSQSSNRCISEIKYRVTGNNLTSYVELKFPLKNILHPIDNIILGPKCKVKENDIDGFLRAENYSDFVVNTSSASYR